MKSKKNNLTTGIIIGIGLIVVPLILMSTKYSNTDEVARYQISTTIHPTLFINFEVIIDTKTGEVVSRKKSFFNNFVKIGKE